MSPNPINGSRWASNPARNVNAGNISSLSPAGMNTPPSKETNGEIKCSPDNASKGAIPISA